MIAVDTNLLVYAHRRDSLWHRSAERAVVQVPGHGRTDSRRAHRGSLPACQCARTVECGPGLQPLAGAQPAGGRASGCRLRSGALRRAPDCGQGGEIQAAAVVRRRRAKAPRPASPESISSAAPGRGTVVSFMLSSSRPALSETLLAAAKIRRTVTAELTVKAICPAAPVPHRSSP